MSKLIPSVYLLVSLFAFSSFETAQAELTGSNTISIVASDNARVNIGTPTQDMDESSTLRVEMNGGVNEISYLRFDMSRLAPMKTVLSAQLNLYKVAGGLWDPGPSLHLYSLTNGVASETTWNAGMTWNTRPTEFGSSLGSIPSSTINAGTSISFNLTSSMMGLITNDTNGQITFKLELSYMSKYNQFTMGSVANNSGYPKPTLTITGIWPPPKGTVLFFR
jgi:hypothetical protein